MRVSLVNGQPGATLSPWDRGLLYGDGAFETVRVYGGRPFALEEHLDQLDSTAASLGIVVERERFRVEAQQAVALAGGGELVLRLLVTRGVGAGAALSSSGAPTRIALVEPWSPPPPDTYHQGVGVMLGSAPGGTLGPKTLDYLRHLRALGEARARGVAEVLLCDPQEGLGQGSTSNVLLVRGSSLIAPAPPEGRAGVTRGRVLGLARARGLSVEERWVAVHELEQADEVFLCSSLREVLPVVAVEGRPVGAGQPGETTRTLHRALRQAAGAAERDV